MTQGSEEFKRSCKAISPDHSRMPFQARFLPILRKTVAQIEIWFCGSEGLHFNH
jgi:hypothetical protein